MRAFRGTRSNSDSSGQIQFTVSAIRRLFDETVTFTPVEMDYKGFVNLVLATENSVTPESIRYFWQLVDYDKSGRLSEEKIKYFYKDVHDCLVRTNYDAPSAAHVVLEIFDLVACNDPRGPTLADLLASKQGHIVMTMLLDVNGFWRYDNRESLMAQHLNEEQEEDSHKSTNQQQQQQSNSSYGSGGYSGRASASSLTVGEGAYDDEDFEAFDD